MLRKEDIARQGKAGRIKYFLSGFCTAAFVSYCALASYYSGRISSASEKAAAAFAEKAELEKKLAEAECEVSVAINNNGKLTDELVLADVRLKQLQGSRASAGQNLESKASSEAGKTNQQKDLIPCLQFLDAPERGSFSATQKRNYQQGDIIHVGNHVQNLIGSRKFEFAFNITYYLIDPDGNDVSSIVGLGRPIGKVVENQGPGSDLACVVSFPTSGLKKPGKYIIRASIGDAFDFSGCRDTEETHFYLSANPSFSGASAPRADSVSITKLVFAESPIRSDWRYTPRQSSVYKAGDTVILYNEFTVQGNKELTFNYSVYGKPSGRIERINLPIIDTVVPGKANALFNTGSLSPGDYTIIINVTGKFMDSQRDSKEIKFTLTR